MTPTDHLLEDLALFVTGIGAMAFLAVTVFVDLGRVVWKWCSKQTNGRTR